MSATDVEVHTQAPLAADVLNNLNPLPPGPSTPLNIKNFEIELKNYPDKNFSTSLLNSLQYGFNVGYDGPEFPSIAKNLKSAQEFPHIIAENILSELKENRMAGPFVKPPFHNFRTSPIGVVPKKDSKKYRTITDLSSPKGSSINDFISVEESAVQFNGFDSEVKIISKLGHGALMAKLDIKSAFRICPVRPANWHLLGFVFQNLYFVDLRLPFGLRSSVNRFTQVSDTLSWNMKTNYHITNSTHYLDDFLLAGPKESRNCHTNMQTTINLFDKLGVPLAPDKIVNPTTTIVYLGIELDSTLMELRLPKDKLLSLNDILSQWSHKKKCTKRELLSLIGKLPFASKIIPSGRTFLRRLINLSTTVPKLHHHISLNKESKNDIQWWIDFLPTWNGKFKILDYKKTLAPDLHLYTIGQY